MADDPITLTLPGDASRALRQAVADGEYGSVDDALADALARWGRRHEEREEELAWIRAKVHASLLDPRPRLSMDEVRAHMDEVFKNARQQDDAAA